MADLATVYRTVDLTSIHCGGCAGTYAINERFRQECHTQGKFWHCPYCDTLWGYGEGELARVKRQLEEQRKLKDQERLWREKAEHQTRAVRGVVTKLKKRAANGICPCCKRTFAQLARHMATKHPEYA